MCWLIFTGLSGNSPQRAGSWGSPPSHPCTKSSEQGSGIPTPQEWNLWTHPRRSIVPEKKPFLTLFLSSSSSSELFHQASWVFRGLSSRFPGRLHLPSPGFREHFLKWISCCPNWQRGHTSVLNPTTESLPRSTKTVWIVEISDKPKEVPVTETISSWLGPLRDTPLFSP